MLFSNNIHLSKAPQSERVEPGSALRLLVSSYGLAAAVAVLAAVSGAGVVAGLLIFWLGGAVAVFALGLIAKTPKPKQSRPGRSGGSVEAPSPALETGH